LAGDVTNHKNSYEQHILRMSSDNIGWTWFDDQSRERMLAVRLFWLTVELRFAASTAKRTSVRYLTSTDIWTFMKVCTAVLTWGNYCLKLSLLLLLSVLWQFLHSFSRVDRVSQARSELLWSVGGRHITGPDDLPAMHPVTQFTASEITLKG